MKLKQKVEASGWQLPWHPAARRVDLGICPSPRERERAKFIPAPTSYLVTQGINYGWKRIFQDWLETAACGRGVHRSGKASGRCQDKHYGIQNR